MDRQKKLRKLIKKFRGPDEARSYFSYTLSNVEIISESAKKIMIDIVPTQGLCANLSAMWAALLMDKHKIPAIVVAGDLGIGDQTVNKCEGNLPTGSKGEKINSTWDGHCWIEVDGRIGDLSVFRTAYDLPDTSLLKNFVINKFGEGRGMMFGAAADLAKMDMHYIPKYVMTEKQINGLYRGLLDHVMQSPDNDKV